MGEIVDGILHDAVRLSVAATAERPAVWSTAYRWYAA